MLKAKYKYFIVCMLSFFVLLCLMIWFVFNNSSKIRTYINKFGTTKIWVISGFVRPFGVRFTDEGELLVSDFGNHSIVKLSKTYEFVGRLGKFKDGLKVQTGWARAEKTIAGQGLGEFNGPHSVDVDKRGKIYVAETYNRRVQVLSQDGKPEEVLENSYLGSSNSIASAYLGSFNNILVSSGANDRLVEIDLQANNGPGGQYSYYFTKEIKLNRPHAARRDWKGNLLVVDTGNHRILKFNGDKKFVGWIGAKKSGGFNSGWSVGGESVKSHELGGFTSPTSLAVDGCGNFVVSEYGNPRIQAFSSNGRFLGWFGGKLDRSGISIWEKKGRAGKGKKVGFVSESYGLDIKGNLIAVSDSVNKRVQIINAPNFAC